MATKNAVNKNKRASMNRLRFLMSYTGCPAAQNTLSYFLLFFVHNLHVGSPHRKGAAWFDLFILILFELIFSSVEGGIHLNHLPFLRSESYCRCSKDFPIYFSLLGFSNLILPLLFHSTMINRLWICSNRMGATRTQ